MNFTFGLRELSLWLATVAIILIITSELLSPYYGRINIEIDKTRLRNAAAIVSFMFIATVIMELLNTSAL